MDTTATPAPVLTAAQENALDALKAILKAMQAEVIGETAYRTPDGQAVALGFAEPVGAQVAESTIETIREVFRSPIFGQVVRVGAMLQVEIN